MGTKSNNVEIFVEYTDRVKNGDTNSESARAPVPSSASGLETGGQYLDQVLPRGVSTHTESNRHRCSGLAWDIDIG